MHKLLRINQGIKSNQIFSFNKWTTIFEYELLAFWATKGQVFNLLFLSPILNLLFFGVGISSFAPKDVSTFGTTNYLAFIFPGILGINIFRTFSHVIYRLTLDKRYGLQGLKISAGTGILGYILGMFIVPTMICIIQACVVLMILIILSPLIGCMYNFLLMLTFGIISTWFWSSLAILVSFFFKKYAQRDLFINLTVLPLTLASPAFYSLHHTPKYLQTISKFNPLTYNIIALRESFLHGKCSGSFVTIFIFTLLFICIASKLIAKGAFNASEC